MKKNVHVSKMIMVLLIALLLVPFSLITEAVGPVGAGTGGASETKRNVIVGFKEQAPGLAVAEVNAVGGKVSRSFKHVPAVAAELSEAEISELSKNKRVAYIEDDVMIEALAEQIPWGVEHTNAPVIWPYTGGKGVKVAVLDTGVDINHIDLTFRGGINTIDGSCFSGIANHGSHVSGIIGALANSKGIVGMAPAVELYSVKVLQDDGKGTLSALIAGLDWAVENGIDIVNMSLGTSTDTNALKSAVDRAYAAGILLVAAAGNSGTADGNTDTIRYPAKYESVIAVGAVNNNSQRASFSATGPALELTAPGVSIYSTIPGSRYALASGTSMAAPHVAGAAALIWSKNPDFTNAQVRKALREGAVQAGSTYQYGHGIINLEHWVPQPEPSNPGPSANFDLTIKLLIGSRVAYTNDKTLLLDVEPYIDAVAKRTMVPIRFISESMGAEVGWNEEKRQVSIDSGNCKIILTIGSTTVSIDGQRKLLDVAPVVKDGRTFVPVRFVGETFGANVSWDSVLRKVTIQK